MAEKKCDWCGRWYTPMFSGDRDLAGSAADMMGLGILKSAGKGIGKLAGKKNFCSAECKRAWKEDYEQRKANGQLTAGEQMREEITAPVKDAFSEAGNQVKDAMAEPMNQTKDMMKDSFGKIGGMFKGFGFGKKK